jgi:hypothetical protein
VDGRKNDVLLILAKSFQLDALDPPSALSKTKNKETLLNICTKKRKKEFIKKLKSALFFPVV